MTESSWIDEAVAQQEAYLKRMRGGAVLVPDGQIGSPLPTAHPDHQPCVPTAGGVPPFCTCGVVGGNGIDTPLLVDHLREHDPSYGGAR